MVNYIISVNLQKVNRKVNYSMKINETVIKIQNLCNQNNIAIDAMLKKCNLNPSVIDNMKKGSMPSVDKILTIAKYFNVSVDYLLGYTPKNQSTEKLLAFASKLTDEQIDTFIETYSRILEQLK